MQLEILDESAEDGTHDASGQVAPGSTAWCGICGHDGPKQVELRTTPPDNPQIWEEARFKGQRHAADHALGHPEPQRAGPIAAPGRYRCA